MPSGLGHAAFRIGVFIAMTSGLLLLFLERDTAEFVLMVAMFVISIVFLAVIAIVVRVFQRR